MSRIKYFPYDSLTHSLTHSMYKYEDLSSLYSYIYIKNYIFPIVHIKLIFFYIIARASVVLWSDVRKGGIGKREGRKEGWKRKEE